MRLRLGKSTPAILAKALPPLSLPLFVTLVFADHTNNAFSFYHFAFAADLLH
jgi:hypothetical protein